MLILAQSAQIVLHIQREMALHIDYCASFGLSTREMEETPETIGKEAFFLLFYCVLPLANL